MTRKYQGVTAYVGMPGSGKTYGLAEEGARALRRGRHVWSNAGFDFGRIPAAGCTRHDPPMVEQVRDGQVELVPGPPVGECSCSWREGCHTYGSFEGLEAVPMGATILIDEAPLYFNARKWQEFPDGFFYNLTQVRKDGMQLYYSTIDWRMVDAQLRRMTFWVWECRAITGRLLRRSKYPPEERRKKDERPRRSEWVRVRSEVGSLYDTHGKVAVASSRLRELPAGSEQWTELGTGESRGGGEPTKEAAAVDHQGESEPRRIKSAALPAVTLTIRQPSPSEQ